MASRRREGRERGFGAVYFLVLLAASAVMLLSLSERVGVGVRRSELEARRAQAHYLALAGAERAVWRLQHEPCFLKSNPGATFTDSLAGGQYTYRVLGTSASLRIEATGALGSARYALDRRIDRLPGPSPATLVCGPNAPNRPAALEYESGAWGLPGPTALVTDGLHWCVLRGSTKRDECLLATEDDAANIQVQVRANGAWRSLATVSVEGRTGSRCFDLAYESNSGDAVLVYRASEQDVYWQTWNGTALGPAQALALPFTTPIHWLALTPQSGTDWMTLIALSENGELAGALWNGAAFADTLQLDSGLDADTECAAACFVGSTGTALFVWSGSLLPSCRLWSGAWAAAAAPVPLVLPSSWLRLASHPQSTRVLLAAQQKDRRLQVLTWTGLAWDASSARVLTDDTLDERWRGFDLAFDFDGDCLLAYGVRSTARLRGAVWNTATGWSAQPEGPEIGTEIHFVQLRSDPATKLVHFAATGQFGGEEQLFAGAWTGAWGAATCVATSLSVQGRESFMLGARADACLVVP